MNETQPTLPGLEASLIPDLAEAAMSDEWWWECAYRAMLTLAVSGDAFSVDHLRDMGVPEPDHGNRWGALFLTAARWNLIIRVSDTQATRRPSHGRRVGTWRGHPRLAENAHKAPCDAVSVTTLRTVEHAA